MLWYTEFTNRRKHTVSVWFWQTLLWICDSHHSNSLFLWNSRNEDVNDSRSFQLHINNYHDNNCIWQVKFTRNWLYVHLQEFFKKWYPIKSSLMGQFSFRCSLTGKEFTEEVLTSEAYARLRQSVNLEFTSCKFPEKCPSFSTVPDSFSFRDFVCSGCHNRNIIDWWFTTIIYSSQL